MECLSFRCLVNACVRVVRVGANITDVPENVARCVLRSCRSEMRAYTAKDSSGEFLAVVRDRKTTYDLETEAIEQLLLELLKASAEARKRESFLGNPGYVIRGGEV